MSRVLLIIHDPNSLATCKKMLAPRNEIFSISDISDASLTAAKESAPHHILIDEGNPDLVGLTPLQRMDKISLFFKKMEEAGLKPGIETHYFKSPVDRQVIHSFSF